MDCYSLFDSGNYAYRICEVFEKKGYVFEVVSTPCKIAKGGCGYSLKHPYEYCGEVKKTAKKLGLVVRAQYIKESGVLKSKYKKL